MKNKYMGMFIFSLFIMLSLCCVSATDNATSDINEQTDVQTNVLPLEEKESSKLIETSKHSVDENNIYVSENGSDSNAGTQANPYLTLGKAVNSSLAGQTNNIYLSGGVFKSGNDLKLNITKDTVIIGESPENTTISGDNLNGVLASVDGASLTLKNLTISNFYKKIVGNLSEGVITSNSNVTLNNVVICDNIIETSRDTNETVTIYTGVIYSSGFISIDNSTGYNNTVDCLEGKTLAALRAVADWGGIVCSFNGTSINNSKFYNNTANRGSVVYGTTLSTLSVDNSIFENNTAYYCGGIFLMYFNCSTTINNSYFYNNNGTNAGGIIYQQRWCDMTVENSQFIHNYANTGGSLYAHHYSTLNTTNCTYEENRARTGAGIIGADDVILTIQNCSFKNNNASEGAVMCDEGCQVTVDKSVFENNIATFGPAIFGDMINNITLTNSNVTNNTATYGGAIFATFNTTVTITNNTFTNNTAENGSVVFVDNTGKLDEEPETPAQEGISSTIISTNNKFTNNKASDNEVIVNYPGANFSTQNDTYTENNIATNINLTTNNPKKGENINITINVSTIQDYGLTPTGSVDVTINGSTQTYTLEDGTTTINYTIPEDLESDNMTIKVKYISDDANFANQTSEVLLTNLTRNDAEIKIISDLTNIKAGDTVKLVAMITSNGTIIKSGLVVFKLNGNTLKYENESYIRVKVVNGVAEVEYTIPENMSAQNYTLTAVYGQTTKYSRAESNQTITLRRINTHVEITPIYHNGQTATIQARIIGENNQNVIGTTRVSIKLNGITIYNQYNVTNGIINLTYDMSKLPNTIYTLDIIAGENGKYLTSKATNVLIKE